LLAADLHAEVEQACERDDVSQSQLFRAAVKSELDRRARITAAQELADAAAPKDADA
jgi:DNA-binding transcriptional regulator/RsmH inhibitor MraZ